MLWSPAQWQILLFVILTSRRQLTQAFQMLQGLSQQCIYNSHKEGSVLRTLLGYTRLVCFQVSHNISILPSSPPWAFWSCQHSAKAVSASPLHLLEVIILSVFMEPSQQCNSIGSRCLPAGLVYPELHKVLYELFTPVVSFYRNEYWCQVTWKFMGL